MIVIDPEWDFDEVLAAAWSRYKGHGQQSLASKLSVLRAWGSVVGRERALAEFGRFRARYEGSEEAARALGMAASTFKKLDRHYRRLHPSPVRGLTLTFDTRLHRFDPTAFDIFIGEVLGPDTDVTIEERSNIGDAGQGYFRLNGSSPEDLVTVAEAFYDRVWDDAVKAAEDAALIKTMSSGFAMVLGRLSHQRDHLARIEENVGILDNADVQEMLAGQGEAYVLAKDKRLLQTRFQRITNGVAAEVQRRTVGQLGSAIHGEVEAGVAGLLGGGGDDVE